MQYLHEHGDEDHSELARARYSGHDEEGSHRLSVDDFELIKTLGTGRVLPFLLLSLALSLDSFAERSLIGLSWNGGI